VPQVIRAEPQVAYQGAADEKTDLRKGVPRAIRDLPYAPPGGCLSAKADKVLVVGGQGPAGIDGSCVPDD
jgi:hypothetical protein